MNQARRQFLAASGFARNVDRCLATRQLLDHLPHLMHAGGVANQQLQRIFRVTPATRQAKCRLDQGAQLFQPDRLRQIIEGTRLQCGDSVFGTTEGGNHRHRRLTVVLTNITNNLQTLAVRQTHIGQTKLKSPGIQRGFSLGNRADALGNQPHSHQGQVNQFTDIGFIIDHQYPHQFVPRTSFTFRYRHVSFLPEIMKCAPPGPGTSSSVAPFAAHSSRAMNRPSPVP